MCMRARDVDFMNFKFFIGSKKFSHEDAFGVQNGWWGEDERRFLHISSLT